MQTAEQQTLDHTIVRLEDPQFYLDNPHAVYARMRKEAPVFWYEPLGFWAVTRQEEIKEVAKGMQFSSNYGTIINDFRYDQIVKNEFLEQGAEFLVFIDPPRHTAMRKIINPSFGPAMIARLEDKIRTLAGEILDKIPSGETIDFVQTVSAPVPIIVIAELLGLREYDTGTLQQWSDDFISNGNAVSHEELSEFAERVGEMRQFFRDEIEAQRTDPQSGVISELITAEVDGERLDVESLIAFYQLLLVAGNETTRNSLSAQMHLLLQHSDQLQRLREDPSLCVTAADETVRYFTPVIGFMRVAREDLTLGGQQIKKNDPVYMVFASGNRDEAVFDNPNTYDVGRPKNPGHVGFGFGWHFCVGASLARMEIKVVYEELLKRFPRFELAGEAVRGESILVNIYASLPVKLYRD